MNMLDNLNFDDIKLPQQQMPGLQPKFGPPPQRSGIPGMLGSRRMLGMRALQGGDGVQRGMHAPAQQLMMQASGGVRPGNFNGPNAVQAARQAGPDLEKIRADMARHNMGAAMGPGNAALAGYMMGK